ncbi:hypothetical protein [Leuconostoc mesenteroides]|uniref:hypothetical protein n=1 Tax=Leuconostoc mesenteroides TaxID=1245 RepID=UPI0015F50B77|nr:hypothetical protein [Leuconostoc mesenteroides]MBA5972548.1 hypothetical protein [Leuconostoc mesenteroides]MCT3045931.1 hypothetical protein [Leuconostoc mesenteroides]
MREINLKRRQLKNKTLFSPFTYIIVTIIFLYLLYLVHDLGKVPGLFFDEANYAAEVRSFSTFGTDIHGLRFPVYLSSVWGQGQSILYTIFAVPFVKLFGFSMFVFRLPMVLIGLTFIALMTYTTKRVSKNNYLTLFVLTMLISSPWTFMSLRWVLDANIGPLILNLGVCLIVLGLSGSNSLLNNQILIYSGFIFMALSAYGYMALWLYLPLLIIMIFIFALKNNLLSIRDVLISSVAMFVIALPIILFAIKIFVFHGSGPSHFLFFDLPSLPGSRQSSLIDFSSKHILIDMWNNFQTGINFYISGFDKLPWNSINGYGVLYPIFLIFTIIGLIIPSKFYKNYETAVYLWKLMILTFLPLTFVIRPNFNHWNVVNFPIIIVSAFGLYFAFSKIKNYFSVILITAPVIIMLIFMTNYWGNRSFSKNGMISYSIVNKLNNTTKGHKVFISNLTWNFAYFKLIQNVSPEEYNNEQDHLNAFKMAPKYRFTNLIDITKASSESKSGDFILVSNHEYPFFYQSIKRKMVYKIPWGQDEYILYKIVK